MSVHTSFTYARHSSLVPVLPASRQPSGLSRCAGQIEYLLLVVDHDAIDGSVFVVLDVTHGVGTILTVIPAATHKALNGVCCPTNGLFLSMDCRLGADTTA